MEKILENIQPQPIYLSQMEVTKTLTFHRKFFGQELNNLLGEEWLMKRKVMLLAILIGTALLITLAVQYSTHAQQQRGEGGGGRRRQGGSQMVTRMMPLEAAWSYISFEMDVADDALPKIRAIFQKTWNTRKEMAKEMADGGGGREAMQEMQSVAEKAIMDMAMQLTDVMTPEQMEKLDKWQKAYQEQAQRQRRGGANSGGGGRQRGGAQN